LGEIAFRAPHRHLNVELPVETRSAAPINRRIGATSMLAKDRPIHTADNSIVSAITAYTRPKAVVTPVRRASSSANWLMLKRVSFNCDITRGSRRRAT